jgi:hypothetical protein
LARHTCIYYTCIRWRPSITYWFSVTMLPHYSTLPYSNRMFQYFHSLTLSFSFLPPIVMRGKILFIFTRI